MGKKNVVLWDGTTVAVDEELASKLRAQDAQPETVTGAGAREVDTYNNENTSPLRAGAEGALDTLTLGAYGAVNKLATGGGERMQVTAQQHPLARTIGETAAVLAPYGALGKTLKAATSLSGIGAAAKLGETGGTLARLAEGAIISGGGKIAESNISGDPLTIEGMVESMSIGGALNAGFGMVADKISAAAAKAAGVAKSSLPSGELAVKAGVKNSATPLAAAGRAAEELDQAQLNRARAVLDSDPAYGSFKAAHESAQAETRAYNSKVTKDAAAYDKAASPAELNKKLGLIEKEQQSIRAELSKPIKRDANGLFPPQSDEELASFNANKARLAELSDSNQSVREAIKAGDTDAAISTLRKHFPDLPVKPGELKAVGPKLPDTLSELGSRRTQTIADIANSTEGDAKGELDKLAQRMGIEPTENPGDMLSEMHKHLNNFSTRGRSEVELAQFSQASADVDAARATTGGPEELHFAEDASGGAGAKPKPGLIARAQAAAKHGLQYGIARGVDSGGWTGAIMRTMVGGGIGYALDGAEGALIGTELVNGKAAVQAKVAGIVERFGPGAAKVASSLGPVSARLSSKFPSGEPDHGTEEEQAVARMHDIAAASHMAPDVLFEMSRGLMGMPGDIALKMAQKFNSGLQYLSATAPKDPGLNMTMTGSDWAPSFLQMDEWTHRYEAVLHPAEYLARVLLGDGHPSGVDALALQWPAILNEARDKASSVDWTHATAEQIEGLSHLFQKPMTALNHPDVQMVIQGHFLPGGQGAQPAPQGKTSSGNANGRPPAVNSSVAGSSVAGLTKQ